MKRFKAAFTLIEVLVVMGILLVLAAIVLTVYSRSRTSGYQVREINQLRQLFVAVNLYEQDYDHQSPISLVDVVPTYAPSETLMCPTDVRRTAGFRDYPANPWAFYYFGEGSDLNDSDSIRKQRSSFMNSYMYLRSFIAHISRGHTYEEYRNNPEVGFLVGTGLLHCGKPSYPAAIQGCDYRIGPTDPGVNYGQPPLNMLGVFLTVRTDGSLATRTKPFCGDNVIGFQTAFLFADSGCSDH